MTACAIRYRLDGPGPAAYLVECDGRLHLYTRGRLGAALPAAVVPGMLANRGVRWVPAAGELIIERPAGRGGTRPLTGPLPDVAPPIDPVDLAGQAVA